MTYTHYQVLRVEVEQLSNIGLLLQNVKDDLLNEIDQLQLADKCGSLSALYIENKYNELENKIYSYEP